MAKKIVAAVHKYAGTFAASAENGCKESRICKRGRRDGGARIRKMGGEKDEEWQGFGGSGLEG